MPYDNESLILDWFKDLKRYAKAFYEKIVSTNDEFKNFVKYDESTFDKIFEKYKAYRDRFHTIISGKLIDRHKIMAGIMLGACRT